jgi:SNF2 family DNA or RNA helicase
LAARLRDRSAALRALPPPALPAGLRASLRPYQLEGYHFLAHLASQGLGGVLADDMGLGKTLQTLAWLLWLADRAAAEGRPFRALVVAPKSVVPNWAVEAGRFAPTLTTARSIPGNDLPDTAQILVINYVQLRLRAPELSALSWDAVVLDEGQNIKNPGSATARAARDLKARHRLVLTGTPIENRLLDLWSLVAFAQPGLLGSQASFQRLYNDKEDPSGARSRLATRVRPFLLRRTKGQVARDLPARIEEEIGCELEGAQRALYEAELKRARQLLLKVGDNRQFDAQRFNILQSLLRLRQICCDPRLIGHNTVDPVEQVVGKKRGRPSKKSAAATSSSSVASAVTSTSTDDAAAVIDTTDEDAPARPSSAKLDALLDTVEPLVAEGHRVLVFSQFVSMLELIRTELAVRGIGHLLLTGQTENRQALVDKFQAADGPPVFLLSLKAAGSGLNLTAASYVILYDPWWNPAVEAQAIDRTHRIGQKSTVMAYRLIAKNTVEEKIRALQREKSELAAAVVQEESLATVMDLDSLRRILG